MHRIDSANARPDVNGAGKAGYHLNTDLSGVHPTNLDPAALNALQEELCTVIEEAAIALEKGTNNQLLTALQALFASISGNVDETFDVKTATADTHAPTFKQLNDGLDEKADTNGDSTETFDVKTATADAHAPTFKQLNDGLGGKAAKNGDFAETFSVGDATNNWHAMNYRKVTESSMNAFKAFGAFYMQMSTGVQLIIPPKATYRIVVIGAGGGGAGYLTGDGGDGTDSYLTISGGAEICRAKGGIGSKQGTGHSVHDTWPPRGRNAISINGDNLPQMIVTSKNDPDLVNLSKVHNYGQGSPRDTSYDGVPNVYTSSEAGHGGVLEFIIKNINPTNDLVLDVTVGSGGLKTGGDGTDGHDGVVAVMLNL